LIQKGIKRIVYGPNVAVKSSQDKDAQEACANMLVGQNIEVVHYDSIDFLDVLLLIFKYMDSKGLDVKGYLRARGVEITERFNV
jgi:hypothetical protein